MGLSENRMGYPQNSTEKNPHFHLYGLHPPLFRVTPTNIQFSWLLCVLKSHSITRNYHIPSNHHKITINHDQSPQHHKTITTESSEQNTINYMCLWYHHHNLSSTQNHQKKITYQQNIPINIWDCCLSPSPSNHHQITIKSPSNHHQITIQSPSNHHRITIQSPENHHLSFSHLPLDPPWRWESKSNAAPAPSRSGSSGCAFGFFWDGKLGGFGGFFNGKSMETQFQWILFN